MADGLFYQDSVHANLPLLSIWKPAKFTTSYLEQGLVE